ncbi:hypothetical protein F4821DRAFT_276728 [Hypoxylon rubiginosum]|uniref:Uncharacterized protein n=1 Tax=Hypoxylon rubiginosum TaxID=110542 RepID=A0ACC0DJM6_9PEZI|nr:hypothetical protein F4821DRAFT_276728 [Hypoxylon rubiginosum]
MPSTAEQRRGPWSRSEDDRLRQLVDLRGPTNWVAIANELGTRSAKQCRERYHQNLKQSLDHTPIRPDEGVLINTMVNQIGKRWAEIARHLHNRCDNTVKNWWNGGQNRRIRKDRRRASRQFGRVDETHEGQIHVTSHSYSSHGRRYSSIYLPGSQRELACSSGTAIGLRPPSLTSPRLYALSHRPVSSSSWSLSHSYPQHRSLPGPGLPSPSTASQSSIPAEYYSQPSNHFRGSSTPMHYGDSHALPLTPGSQSSASSSPTILPLLQPGVLCDDDLRLPPISCQQDDHHSQSPTVLSPRQLPLRISTLNLAGSIQGGHQPEVPPRPGTYDSGRGEHASSGLYHTSGGPICENIHPTHEPRALSYPPQTATTEALEYTYEPRVSGSEVGTILFGFGCNPRMPRTVVQETQETQAPISERPAERARRKMTVDDLIWNAAS